MRENLEDEEAVRLGESGARKVCKRL